MGLRVGVVGTGYAAQKRLEALLGDRRVERLCLTGEGARAQKLIADRPIDFLPTWGDLLGEGLDLVIVATENHRHGAIARAALGQKCHLVVEYPLCLDPAEGWDLLALARSQDRLLHIEHIELLGGVHPLIRRYLPELGEIIEAEYRTVKPQQPAPRRWSYDADRYGFPFVAALSRVQRLTDLLGRVDWVRAVYRPWPHPPGPEYGACWCWGQLHFVDGAIAQLTYAKGDRFMRREQVWAIGGDRGRLVFQGTQGVFQTRQGETPLTAPSRRGLFAEDTRQVLDHLETGSPLYIEPEASLYALGVGDRLRIAAATGETVRVTDQTFPPNFSPTQE